MTLVQLTSNLKKSTAWGLSLALIFTSLNLSAAAPLSAGHPSRFAPPASLGSVLESYVGSDPRTVVLLEDLHINYDAQKSLQGLLAYFAKKGILPPSVAVEGAEGTIDASSLASYPDAAVRHDVADYFIRKGELPGPGAYAVETGRSTLLYGIEKGSYYEFNRSLYRKSFAARRELAFHLRRMEGPIAALKRKEYSRSMRGIDRLGVRYFKGELTEEDYARALADLRSRATTPVQKKLIEMDRTVQLLGKLLRQQAVEGEVREIASDLNQSVGILKTTLNLDPATLARATQAVKASIEFYVLAATREVPMLDNTLARMTADKSPIGILVAGGFHAKGLTEALRAKGISFVVIVPEIHELKSSDEKLYEDRLMGRHVTVEEVLADYSPSAPGGSGQAMSAGFDILRTKMRDAQNAAIAAAEYRRIRNASNFSAERLIPIVSQQVSARRNVNRATIEEYLQHYVDGLEVAPDREEFSFLNLRKTLSDHYTSFAAFLVQAPGYVAIQGIAALRAVVEVGTALFGDPTLVVYRALDDRKITLLDLYSTYRRANARRLHGYWNGTLGMVPALRFSLAPIEPRAPVDGLIRPGLEGYFETAVGMPIPPEVLDSLVKRAIEVFMDEDMADSNFTDAIIRQDWEFVFRALEGFKVLAHADGRSGVRYDYYQSAYVRENATFVKILHGGLRAHFYRDRPLDAEQRTDEVTELAEIALGKRALRDPILMLIATENWTVLERFVGPVARSRPYGSAMPTNRTYQKVENWFPRASDRTIHLLAAMFAPVYWYEKWGMLTFSNARIAREESHGKASVPFYWVTRLASVVGGSATAYAFAGHGLGVDVAIGMLGVLLTNVLVQLILNLVTLRLPKRQLSRRDDPARLNRLAAAGRATYRAGLAANGPQGGYAAAVELGLARYYSRKPAFANAPLAAIMARAASQTKQLFKILASETLQDEIYEKITNLIAVGNWEVVVSGFIGEHVREEDGSGAQMSSAEAKAFKITRSLLKEAESSAENRVVEGGNETSETLKGLGLTDLLTRALAQADREGKTPLILFYGNPTAYAALHAALQDSPFDVHRGNMSETDAGSIDRLDLRRTLPIVVSVLALTSGYPDNQTALDAVVTYQAAQAAYRRAGEYQGASSFLRINLLDREGTKGPRMSGEFTEAAVLASQVGPRNERVAKLTREFAAEAFRTAKTFFAKNNSEDVDRPHGEYAASVFLAIARYYAVLGKGKYQTQNVMDKALTQTQWLFSQLAGESLGSKTETKVVEAMEAGRWGDVVEAIGDRSNRNDGSEAHWEASWEETNQVTDTFFDVLDSAAEAEVESNNLAIRVMRDATGVAHAPISWELKTILRDVLELAREKGKAPVILYFGSDAAFEVLSKELEGTMFIAVRGNSSELDAESVNALDLGKVIRIVVNGVKAKEENSADPLSVLQTVISHRAARRAYNHIVSHPGAVAVRIDLLENSERPDISSELSQAAISAHNSYYPSFARPAAMHGLAAGAAFSLLGVLKVVAVVTTHTKSLSNLQFFVAYVQALALFIGLIAAFIGAGYLILYLVRAIGAQWSAMMARRASRTADRAGAEALKARIEQSATDLVTEVALGTSEIMEALKEGFHITPTVTPSAVRLGARFLVEA